MNPMNIFARMMGRNSRPSAVSPARMSAIFGVPMAISQASFETLSSAAYAPSERGEFRSSDASWEPYGSKPEHLIEIKGDVGVLFIAGPLFHRFGVDAWWFGGQGYDVIVSAHRQLVADSRVREIVHVYDTGGGQCAGCFDAADEIRATRGTKKITAVVSDAAYSAGYALACSADEVVISRTGGVGSIGVRSTHLDVTGWDSAVGLRYSTITSGERKADGDMHLPLSDKSRESTKAEVDRLADMFFQLVADSRGMSFDEVKAMQAMTYHGSSAVDVGLADRIATLDEVLIASMAAIDSVASIDASTDGQSKIAAGSPAAENAPAAEVLPLAIETAPVANAVADALAELQAATERAQAEIAAQPDPLASLVAAVAASKLPPALGLALINKPPEGMAADAAVAYAAKVRDLCAAAGVESLASDLVAAGTSVEAARAQLLDLRADTGPEIVTAIPAKATAKAATPLDVQGIYESRRKRQ